jgi:hypothetical protein
VQRRLCFRHVLSIRCVLFFCRVVSVSVLSSLTSLPYTIFFTFRPILSISLFYLGFRFTSVLHLGFQHQYFWYYLMSHLGLLEFSLVMKPNSFYVADIPICILVQTNISLQDLGFQPIILSIPIFHWGFQVNIFSII